MDFFNLKAEGESVHKEVRMRKNHCRMNITLKTDGGNMPDLKVVSDVCG